MPSPFPGMDPSLENPELWSDFHHSFIACIRFALNDLLPEQYYLNVERHVWVEDLLIERNRVVRIPYVRIMKKGGTAVLGKPKRIKASYSAELPLSERKGIPYLRIHSRKDKRLITAIELLSPVNKAKGANREAYRAKRVEYLGGGVNLVEMDLLRRWPRMPLHHRSLPESDYRMVVCRASAAPKAGVWVLSVRDVLPDLPIPLEKNVKDVELKLQEIFVRCYDQSGFRRELDYLGPPDPPLASADQPWSEELLADHR